MSLIEAPTWQPCAAGQRMKAAILADEALRRTDGGTEEGGRRESNSLGRTDGETEGGGRPPRTAEDDVDNGLNGCGKVDYAQGDVPPVTPQSLSLTHSELSPFS